MEPYIVELVGYMAAVLTTFATLPQVVKIIRTRETRGISILKYIMNLAGSVCWLVFGIGIGSMPTIITSIVALPLIFIVFVYLVKDKFKKS